MPKRVRPADRKGMTLGVSVTEDEYQSIATEAEEMGISLSAWMRRAAQLDGRVMPAPFYCDGATYSLETGWVSGPAVGDPA